MSWRTWLAVLPAAVTTLMATWVLAETLTVQVSTQPKVAACKPRLVPLTHEQKLAVIAAGQAMERHEMPSRVLEPRYILALRSIKYPGKGLLPVLDEIAFVVSNIGPVKNGEALTQMLINGQLAAPCARAVSHQE